MYLNFKSLGVKYEEGACEFGIFSPQAKEAAVMLYPQIPMDYAAGEAYRMEADREGIWRVRVTGKLKNYIYMFRIRNADGEIVYARDPYAFGVTANGRESVILDMRETDPEGFAEYKHIALKHPVDAVIYEMHIRDFSMDENIPFRHRGKFLSVAEHGLKTAQGRSAGIDSLCELGITHVQILPFFDSAAVDETRVDNPDDRGRKYNWGYDPHNYNVPEGSYATDCHDPQTRIRECKKMIMELHKAGLGVIMDVVYNHTYSVEEGPFEKTAPGYYYRKDGEGLANGSACGNEVASEREMARAYIINSLKFWVEEYGVDGFRFDLMGLIDVDTMRLAAEELRKIKPDILLYGEPWQAGGSVLPEEKQTVKGRQRGLGFGVFNDDIRDALRGSTKGRDGGFAVGRKGFENLIAEAVCGSLHTFAENPGESINYAGAHDDLNLWDKVITSLGQRGREGFLNIKDGKFSGGSLENALKRAELHHGITRENIWEVQSVRACVLANAVVLLSQGVPFLYEGDEMLNSKYGDANSFQSGDAINRLCWNDKDKFPEIFEFYQALIRLRKEHPAFRMTGRGQVEKCLQITECGRGCVAFVISGVTGDSWRHIFTAFYSAEEEKRIILPGGQCWKSALKMPGRTQGSGTDTEIGEIRLQGIDMQVAYAL